MPHRNYISEGGDEVEPTQLGQPQRRKPPALKPNYVSGGGDEDEPKQLPEVAPTDIFAHHDGAHDSEATFAPVK